MRLHTDDRRHEPGLPGCSESGSSLGWLAAGAGLAGASALVLLAGLSDLGIVLGLPPWSAYLLSGVAGLAGAVAAWRGALRHLPPAGLTPAQALSQLRHDLDLASAATANPREPGSARNAGALG